MSTDTQVAIVADDDTSTSFWYAPMPGLRTPIASRTEPGTPTDTATPSAQGATTAGPSRTAIR